MDAWTQVLLCRVLILHQSERDYQRGRKIHQESHIRWAEYDQLRQKRKGKIRIWPQTKACLVYDDIVPHYLCVSNKLYCAFKHHPWNCIL